MRLRNLFSASQKTSSRISKKKKKKKPKIFNHLIIIRMFLSKRFTFTVCRQVCAFHFWICPSNISNFFFFVFFLNFYSDFNMESLKLWRFTQDSTPIELWHGIYWSRSNRINLSIYKPFINQNIASIPLSSFICCAQLA